jgi:hypothetical protein
MTTHIDTIPNDENRSGRLVLSVPRPPTCSASMRALGYELVARGELPSLRLGRRIVVPRAALLNLVDGE